MKLDNFTRAYIECALWSSTDNSDDSGGDPLDRNYGIEDIADEAIARIVEDCKAFRETYGELLDKVPETGREWSTDEQNGHDFWLTRNGHGTGFWDRGYGELGRQLTNAAETFGACDLYVGDDGILYLS